MSYFGVSQTLGGTVSTCRAGFPSLTHGGSEWGGPGSLHFNPDPRPCRMPQKDLRTECFRGGDIVHAYLCSVTSGCGWATRGWVHYLVG